GGALIEARLGGRVRCDALDEEHSHAGTGEAEGETRAYETTAHDGDVEVAQRLFICRRRTHRRSSRAVLINFSIAATSFGAPSVSTSTPFLVTTTSSSIRTPIRCRRFGTPRAPAGM